jgi:hypothetical protein
MSFIEYSAPGGSTGAREKMINHVEEPRTGGFATLAPEFVVGHLAASLHFWCDLLGFRIAYQRPEDDFAYLERDGAQVMLEVSSGAWQPSV